ncbi:hypothetical protein N2152v2_007299 [Parachlorella kessleri]
MTDISGTHTVYQRPEGESTQWEDLQRKQGNLAPAEPVWKPDAYKAEEVERKDKQWLDSKEADELDELEDEFADDRAMEEYRRKRMEELRKGTELPKFGALEQIRGTEFVEKVTNAGQGVWVVCLLYKDSVPDCSILAMCLGELAQRYPNTKFVKIVSTDCIPNYPDDNLPTVLLYKDTKCLQHVVGLRTFGGKSTSPEQVAIMLNRYGDVCGDKEEQEQQVRSLVSRLIEQQEQLRVQQEDEDSDFD